MKVTEVNSPAFAAKQRSLSKKGFANMQKLLTKMNEQTVCTNPTPDRYVSKVLSRLYINNEGFFMDCRWLPKKNYLPTALIQGDSFVQTNKTKVRISNYDGKLEILERPWYRSSKGVAKKVEKFIKTGLDEFDNLDVVEKKFYGIEGYTQSALYEGNYIR